MHFGKLEENDLKVQQEDVTTYYNNTHRFDLSHAC